MTHDEAQSELALLFKKTNTTLATRYKLYFQNRILTLEPALYVKTGVPIICTLTDSQIRNGLSVGQWIRITNSIVMQFEELVKCQQP